ncbi:hypothetical protein LEP1GSC048_1223 [Leptospira santarosai serovar Shermani str. 1342KT]|nr:hypothetical protein LEP1GSC048_1223 [Leptospira santarosai serovar Shermani str. 1342KT]
MTIDRTDIHGSEYRQDNLYIGSYSDIFSRIGIDFSIKVLRLSEKHSDV